MGTDNHVLRDIDDAREITAFEHILKIIGHPGLKSCKWNIKSISKMRGKSPPSWKYIKEIGNKHQGQFTEPFFQGWSTWQLGGHRGDIWALLLWQRAVEWTSVIITCQKLSRFGYFSGLHSRRMIHNLNTKCFNKMYRSFAIIYKI